MCKHKQTIIKAVRYKKDYLQKVKLCVCVYIYIKYVERKIDN